MSVRVMAMVFDMALPPTEKLVALSLADHAHDDGTEARPGVNGLSVKASVSKRTAQRTLQQLLDKKVIVVQREATNKWPTVYCFPCARRGDSLTPQEINRGDADDALGVTSETSRGDTGVTQTVNNPSLESSSNSSAAVASDVLDQIWKVYPRPESKGATLRVLKTRLKEGYSGPQLVRAASLYALSCLDTEKRFIKLPATFYGPDKHFLDYVDGVGEPIAARSETLLDEVIAEIERIFRENVSCETFDRAEWSPLIVRLFDRLSERELRRMTLDEIKNVLRSLVRE